MENLKELKKEELQEIEGGMFGCLILGILIGFGLMDKYN